jgi:hypothetical protein
MHVVVHIKSIKNRLRVEQGLHLCAVYFASSLREPSIAYFYSPLMPKFIMQSAFTFIALRCPRGKLYSRQCVPVVRGIYPLRSQEREEPHGLRGLVAAKKQENKAGPQKQG